MNRALRGRSRLRAVCAEYERRHLFAHPRKTFVDENKVELTSSKTFGAIVVVDCKSGQAWLRVGGSSGGSSGGVSDAELCAWWMLFVWLSEVENLTM